MTAVVSSLTNSKALCLYHANCIDGLIAAAIVHRFFQGAVECVAVHYGDPVPVELMRDKHVYMVDFAFEVDEFLPHLDATLSTTIIDHHYDNMVPWVALGDHTYEKLRVKYDGKKSGAGLAWDFFFGVNGIPMPIVVQYAQEYDLSTKGLPDTDEVQSGLRYHFPPREAALGALGDFIARSDMSDIVELKLVGSVILRQEMIQVEAMIKRHLMFVNFGTHANIPTCAMPPELVNQAGQLLYTRYPDAPFVVLFEDNYAHGTRKYSFRSRKDGGADVSAIAMEIGGKGHTNSSGAIVKLDLVY